MWNLTHIDTTLLYVIIKKSKEEGGANTNI